ncbi:helix-turn-helix domain-containing protein [Bradyrhizobium jicamae]|uniref:helix-turn-helix domain-containing protein n=1 Tax=Bradyrhizobium jicamae TaxID=280332 RepID=UPI001BAE0382|nr:helix-turn-helix domain-containing protein [Bradyrhizobium jicamae]MBR0937294.1 helix-turn-helix domain-containing protein [Bradyrhizobium jicamae]
MSVSKNPSPNSQAAGEAKRSTADQFAWLRQVALDPVLPAAAPRVAIALTGYFNREHGGWAWPSQQTLADELGLHERTVRTALSAMVERGHLLAKRRGREETNLYHLALKNSDSDRKKTSAHTEEVTGNNLPVMTGKIVQSDRKNRVKVTGRKLPPNPLNEPLEEPFEGKTPPTKGNVRKVTARRRPSTPWPDGFHLEDDLADHAAAKAGWSQGRAFEEFDRFQNHHLAKGSIFSDWRAAWRTWVATGIKFDRERAQQNGAVIDQAGNPNAPPPNRPPPSWRRPSNMQRAMMGGDDD